VDIVHSVMAGWKVNLRKWAGGGDKEAIMDFKDDAGCCNARHSLESRTVVYLMGSSLLRWTVSSPSGGLDGQQLATMDGIITKKEAQITYALMLQLVDGLAAITAMDDSATMKKSIGEVMETKQIGLLQEEIGEEKQISALSDESSAKL